MDRRAFIDRMGSALVAATAATATATAATTGKYQHGRVPVDVESAVRRMDEVCRGIDADPLFDEPSALIARRGFDRRLFRDAIKSMLTVGTFGDLSEQEQAHPLMQRRMWDSAEMFDRTILGMATFLEGTTREERRAMRRTLHDTDRIGRAFQTALDHEGRGLRVPSPRLEHFHTLWNRTVRALQRPTHSTIIDEYIDKVDRVAGRCGITPELRRELALHWDGAKVADLASLAAAGECGAYPIVASAGFTDAPDGYRTRRQEHRRMGYRLLGVSGGVTASGLMMLMIAVAADIEGLIVASWVMGTVAVILLIIALVYAVMGASAGTDSPLRPKEYREADPVYRANVDKAVQWVRQRRPAYDGRLEDLVSEASLQFKVDFNDIWTQVE
jgi:hypothetical protein